MSSWKTIQAMTLRDIKEAYASALHPGTRASLHHMMRLCRRPLVIGCALWSSCEGFSQRGRWSEYPEFHLLSLTVQEPKYWGFRPFRLWYLGPKAFNIWVLGPLGFKFSNVKKMELRNLGSSGNCGIQMLGRKMHAKLRRVSSWKQARKGPTGL